MIYRAFKLIEAGEIETALCVVWGKGSFLRENKATADSVDKFYNISLTPFDEFFRQQLWDFNVT